VVQEHSQPPIASKTSPVEPKPPIKEPVKKVKHVKPFKAVNPDLCPIEELIKKATAATNNIAYGGIPKRLKSERNFEILRNIAFIAGYSEKRDDPLWVAYRIDKREKPLYFKRPHGFKPDYRTIARIKSKDYTRTGYDRGHMAPNAAIMTRYGRAAQLETFKMSNVVPQKPNLNRKVWQRLERLEIKYANKYESVWVITGPIFDDLIEKIHDKVEIPDKFFKIIIDEDKNHIRTLQFIIPQNVRGKESLEKFLTSIDEIEKETNLDFLSPLSDTYEDALESKKPDKVWPFK